ncbi:MAG: oligoendopeptidase F [Chloroflexota bacterium]|nr:oligoendopeptidase F [Chloroflexota bacterium]
MVVQAEVMTRDQVALEETWDLTTLYATDDAWEADMAVLPALQAAAVAHRERMGESASALRAALDDIMAARQTVSRLTTYAYLRLDEETTVSEAKARAERATALAIGLGQALSFVQPEVLAIPEARLAEFLAEPELATYHHLLDDLQRTRPHIRSAEVEELLAQAADVTRIPSDTFDSLNDSDLTYGTVKDDSGTEITLTQGRAMLLLESKNREVRRAAYEGLYGAYVAHRYTMASLHAGSVRTDVFSARVRGYDSARQEALFAGNIPESVYDNLISAVREATPTLERFLNLRRRILGLDDIAVYDLYVPLAPQSPRLYEYREAVDLVLGGLGALGPRYVEDLRNGLNNRWVDVYETKNKTSGGYSWGAYGSPPVILLNWNRTLDDVLTLAHEAGHSMHTYYANAHQPYHLAGYPIFLAEIASTVDEVLMTWHLLAETAADDDLTRFALLNRFADGFYGTVIRQSLYAEFELRTHELVEANQPLTMDALSDLFAELQAVYTPGVTIDDNVRVTWARIPHFYRAFYVFQYATGLSAAITLARMIRDEGEPARDRFLALLSAGGSDYPLTLLGRTGVDLTSPEPVRIGLEEFGQVVSEMERIAERGQLFKA